MKKRKFVGMTNIEYAVRHFGHVQGVFVGDNVIDCPCEYKLQISAISVENALSYNLLCDIENCVNCWCLPAKVNDRWILKEVCK